VEELIKRINKLEDKVKFELVNDKASLSGSDAESDDGHPNAIKEEENEDDDSDKPKKKERRPNSSKVSKVKIEET